MQGKPWMRYAMPKFLLYMKTRTNYAWSFSLFCMIKEITLEPLSDWRVPKILRRIRGSQGVLLIGCICDIWLSHIDPVRNSIIKPAGDRHFGQDSAYFIRLYHLGNSTCFKLFNSFRKFIQTRLFAKIIAKYGTLWNEINILWMYWSMLWKMKLMFPSVDSQYVEGHCICRV